MCGGAPLTVDITQKLNQNKKIVREQEDKKIVREQEEDRHAWDKNKACSARGHTKFHQIIKIIRK